MWGLEWWVSFHSKFRVALVPLYEGVYFQQISESSVVAFFGDFPPQNK
jgi:hypothetical protein